MYDRSPRSSIDLSQSQASDSRRPSTDNVPQDSVLTAVFENLGVSRREVLEETGTRFRRRLQTPVVHLLGAANDGSAVEITGNAERPGAVRVLSCHGSVADVGNEASLAWTSVLVLQSFRGC